jgi:hypothetical protein
MTYIRSTKSQVNQMDETQLNELGKKLEWHSKWPMQTAFEYNRYVVNGMLFRTVPRDEGKTTQNSGVCVPGEDGHTYYGKLTRIIEVEYYDGTRYVLFKCDWADTKINRGYKQDEYGFNLVNFKNLIHTGERITDDPYVLCSQVSQSYYVKDDRDPNWDVAVKTVPRNVYDVGQGEGEDANFDNFRENEPFNLETIHDPNDVGNDNFEYARNDVAPTEVQFQAPRTRLYDLFLITNIISRIYSYFVHVLNLCIRVLIYILL